MNVKEMAVLVDGLFVDEAPSIWKSPFQWYPFPSSGDEAADLLEELFSQGYSTFVLHGGDELAMAVVSAYFRRPRHGANELSLIPLLSQGGLLGALLRGAPVSRAPDVLVRKGNWRREELPTLRVISSLEESPRYGFSFAAGWLHDAMVARQRARGGAANLMGAAGQFARETFQFDGESPSFERSTLDYKPLDVSGDSLVVSSLERTYFGLQSSQRGATLFADLEARTLLRSALTPELLRSNLEGQGFETLHLDGLSSWVLDHQFFEHDHPAVLEISSGPSVVALGPPRGVSARIGGLFR